MARCPRARLGRWQPAAGVHISQRSVLRESLALLASPAGEFLLKESGSQIADAPADALALRGPTGVKGQRSANRACSAPAMSCPVDVSGTCDRDG